MTGKGMLGYSLNKRSNLTIDYAFIWEVKGALELLVRTEVWGFYRTNGRALKRVMKKNNIFITMIHVGSSLKLEVLYRNRLQSEDCPMIWFLGKWHAHLSSGLGGEVQSLKSWLDYLGYLRRVTHGSGDKEEIHLLVQDITGQHWQWCWD